MFEPKDKEINKKNNEMYKLQSNIIKSCKDLKDFTKKIKERRKIQTKQDRQISM